MDPYLPSTGWSKALTPVLQLPLIYCTVQNTPAPTTGGSAGMHACGEGGQERHLQYALPPSLALCTWLYTSGKNFWRKGCMEVTPPVMPLSNLRRAQHHDTSAAGLLGPQPRAERDGLLMSGTREGATQDYWESAVEASVRTRRGARPLTRLCM